MDGRSRAEFIKELASQNRQFYGTEDGLGTLRALKLAFEHRWVYLYELVQNAIDAGAKSISIRVADDANALRVQHDGRQPLDGEDVKALSKVFRSTKGASTVGFMGIGFKSVFGRFRSASISGWGWNFRYEVDQEVGETYGDIQRDLLGTVTPIWDDSIPAPEGQYSTRFELRGLLDPEADLKSDVNHVVPTEDRTPLAILASAGLRYLELDGCSWNLDTRKEENGAWEAVAESQEAEYRWRLFPVTYSPSRDAIARFLEVREVQPQTPEERESVYSAAARARRVVGVLPLDEDGNPNPPERGRVYATAPTNATVPFGLHINADWLLNISRRGLREIGENQWQEEIIDHISDVVVSFVRWVSRTCSHPEHARAAFRALSVPSSDGGDSLESQLSRDRWLRRLRSQLKNMSPFPVLEDHTNRLGFTTASEVVVPPRPLLKALEQRPGLLPRALMKGPVLARKALGPGARSLFERLDLLSPMEPSELQKAWAGGLEDWWERLPEKPEGRRDLLFFLWGAVSEFNSGEEWRDDSLQCVRTAGGTWVSVEEAIYLNEFLPSEDEPGGEEARALIDSFLPDAATCLVEGWVGALRRLAGNEARFGPFGRALRWLRNYGQAISLKEAVEAAVTGHCESAAADDWHPIISLGHWVLNRSGRSDLLTHVIVESGDDQDCIRTNEALIADPYVERGDSRRVLFGELPPISPSYLTDDPKGRDAHEWRSLFEGAGAQGPLRVKTVESHVGRSDKAAVADFLGVEPNSIGRANQSGYTLVDRQIMPELPRPGASEEIRKAIGPWLEDGFSSLRDRGTRKVTYKYHTQKWQTGERKCEWVGRLSALEWVPCDDGALRSPKHVLPDPDPSRAASPVAQLSSDLIRVLRDEGLRFGRAIPEAPAIQRLQVRRSDLGAEDLATLLREIREEPASEEDRDRLAAIVQGLSIPLGEGRRVPIDRVVQRTGGRLRGALGGWIVSFGDIPEPLETELAKSEFPFEFPDTTTGGQALAFLRNVWNRAQSSPTGLAAEVRDVLPAAYAYCLEDQEEEDELSERWRESLADAMVFADRTWMSVVDADGAVFFDDLEDQRLVPSHADLTTATSGHLGNSFPEQLRTATELGLPRLSSAVAVEWRESGWDSTPDWDSRIRLICRLLKEVRGDGSDVRADGTARKEVAELEIRRVRRLELSVRIEDGDPEEVPVNARLRDNILVVAGRPVEFASDAAKELLQTFGFRQRGDLAADLTGILGAIDDPSDFRVATEKFVRSFSPNSELPSPPGERAEDESEPRTPSDESTNDERKDAFVEDEDETDVSIERSYESDRSYEKDRALAQQNAAAKRLREVLKGELAPERDEDESNAEVTPTHEDGQELGDELYREVAAEYERACGRVPEMGDARQAGWDLRSTDPSTGSERLIEVKGKGCLWTEEEVVELTRAQVKRAFQVHEKGVSDGWYVYVVEESKAGSYEVLPIPNPVQLAKKWMLQGGAWRLVAEDPREIEKPW